MNKKYDLIVAGGGITGVAAAVASARRGAKVLIIERYGFLGGAATNCIVNPFMPYYYINNQQERETINAGFFMEIMKRLKAKDGMHKNQTTFNEEILKIVLDEFVTENNVDVLFHSLLFKADCEEGWIKSIRVLNKSGEMSFQAPFFIDCTGDADLAAMAGADFRIGRDEDNLCQPMTLCFRVANVDMDKYKKNFSKIQKLYSEYQKKNAFENSREDILLFPHMVDNILHFNTTRILRHSPVDGWEISKAEFEGRRQVSELFEFLRQNAEGFENAVLLTTAPQIGVRESRMIDGEYLLTQEDLVQGVKFDDAIAGSGYGLDIHNPTDGGTTHIPIKKGDFYTIPYRSLIPKKVGNLLVAGRCISATHEAQSSCRIIPVCCCTGEAAGLAISIALTSGHTVRDIDISLVQDLIVKNGGKKLI